MGSASPGPFVSGLHQLSLPWIKGEVFDGTLSPNLVDLDIASLHAFEAVSGMKLNPGDPPICEALTGPILR